MGGFVSVLDSRELRATLYAIKAAPTAIRKDVRQETRAVIGKEWNRALREQSATVPQSRVLVDTARVRVSDQQVVLTSAASKRKVASGGLVPFDAGKGMEFGAGRNRVRSYRSHRRGTTFTVKRHTTRQMPRIRRTGYVVYPAFAEVAPRALALWVQTTVRVIANALEGKQV